MNTASYQQRRGQIETYFDRTAARAWETLTSTAPVGRIRATVRAGRDRMRATLLSWLPQDCAGMRIWVPRSGTGPLGVGGVAVGGPGGGVRRLAVGCHPGGGRGPHTRKTSRSFVHTATVTRDAIYVGPHSERRRGRKGLRA